MKKRLTSLMLCAVMLMAMLSIGAVAAAPVITVPGNASAADATLLPFTAYYATSDGKTLSALTAFDAATNETLAQSCAGITTDSSTGIPCQVFEFDASAVTTDSVVLTMTASTIENERMALKVFNVTTNAWDTLDTAVTAGCLSAEVDLATYAADGQIKAMITPDYVANGSNRLIWSTDQQHYTKFTDLHATYYGIHEYMAKEYQADNLAYVINTGDIVDDIPTMSGSKAQWVVADKAFDILDDANVPYGIVTGNHDVGDYPTNNYSHYLSHFNESRYSNNPWYGGTIDDNKCHYDLVTVGNVDLLILYIGYGIEDQQSVLNWANSVLAMYPHRSAILATHQYLKPTTLTHEGRADILFNTIVTQNDNVVMVLSGHYDGAGYLTQDIEGRIVQEVIADYQFVQAESAEYYADAPDPLHHIGAVPNCNGEGYIREVIIEGNSVSMLAFSPITGGKMPFGARDQLDLTVNFVPTQRQITTYQAAAATKNGGTATLNEWVGEDGNTVYYVAPSASSATTATVYVDRTNLQALMNTAAAIAPDAYTADSFGAMTTALEAANTAANGSDADVRAAYTALVNAMGALTEKSTRIDRSQLITVADLDLGVTSWENANGTSNLAATRSYVTFKATDNGGFTAKKSPFSPNNWPSIKYTDVITFTPVDGKVYLYLDIEAGSTWSFYPTVIQDLEQYMGRWNYIIEGSYDNTFDAGAGTYRGVYDVTQALIDMGVDVTKKMTLTIEMNVVPGPVTVNAISVLTGTPTPTEPVGSPTPTEPVAAEPTVPANTASDDNTLLIIVAVAVSVVAVAALVAVLVIILGKPKKKETTADEAEDTPAPPTDDQA